MAGNFQNLGNDSLDINELASLNDDVPDELIDQLEQQISEKIGQNKTNTTPQVNENDDSTLFEEAAQETTPAQSDAAADDIKPTDSETLKEDVKNDKSKEVKPEKNSQMSASEKIESIQNFDDNFIKKYKAKLKSRAQGNNANSGPAPSYGGVAPGEDEELNNNMKDRSQKKNGTEDGRDISALSQGKISERTLTGDFKDYNDSLDFLDENVKYSKYVIYIDPQNADFMESLTVKERKNLINNILRQQDDISITKLRFKVIQSVIMHVIITVLTIAISIPIVYYAINASLEATINNHRNAQTNWQTLYKEHGKISPH